jgi:hypothetical protein
VSITAQVIGSAHDRPQRRATCHRWLPRWLLFGAAALALATPAQAHGIGSAGVALEHGTRDLAAPVAICPAGVAVQTITVINEANVRPWMLAKVENAIAAQSLQLRAAWGTPCVRFGPGGWLAYLQIASVSYPDGSVLHPIEGEHYGNGDPGPYWAGDPYAIVDTGALPYVDWSHALSHEILEMLADPTDEIHATPYVLREVCDPVEGLSYQLVGVAVSDFVFPSYFAGGSGPYDEMHQLIESVTIQSAANGGSVPRQPTGNTERYGTNRVVSAGTIRG